ncbi:MAG: cytochrome P450 [Actinomycetes bacterium]
MSDVPLTLSDAVVTPTQRVPGPTGPEMLANIALMRRAPPDFLAQCADRYGAVVRFPIPRSDVFLVSDPSDVRRVLQGNHTAYGKRTIQYDTLALVTGSGLLASDGDLWRRMRRTLSPAFHHERVADMSGAITRVASRWVEKTRASGVREIDLDAAMLELSLQIVGTTLMGGSIGRARSVVDAVMDALQVVVRKAQQPLPIPEAWPTPGKRRFASALAVLEAAVDALLAQRRLKPSGDDALSMLITAADEGNASPREVRDEVVTLIVAGHETVAATLTWTWVLLAAHPDVEQRIHDEVDVMTDGELSGQVDRSRLRYTRAVVDECLRLYPPAWVITRRALDPDVLGGCAIPTGATVIASPYVTQRDARLWPDPLRFAPERFMADAAMETGRGSMTYFPFGAGPRLCIGRDLALLEAPLLIATLARGLRFRPKTPAAIKPDFGVTLRPKGGLPVVVTPRAALPA